MMDDQTIHEARRLTVTSSFAPNDSGYHQNTIDAVFPTMNHINVQYSNPIVQALTLPELLSNVLSWLPRSDLTRTARVNKLWFKESAKVLWTGLDLFPANEHSCRTINIDKVLEVEAIADPTRFHIYKESIREARIDATKWLSAVTDGSATQFRHYGQPGQFIAPYCQTFLIQLRQSLTVQDLLSNWPYFESLFPPTLRFIAIGISNCSDRVSDDRPWEILRKIKCPNLRRIAFDTERPTDLSDIIPKFPRLEDFRIGTPSLWAGSITHLSGLPALMVAEFGVQDGVLHECRFPREPFPKLRSLLVKCMAEDFVLLARKVTKIQSLRATLKLYAPQVGEFLDPNEHPDDSGMQQIPKSINAIGQLNNLLELKLQFSPTFAFPRILGDTAGSGRFRWIIDALKNCPNLRGFELDGPIHFSIIDHDIIGLAQSCPKLEVLHLGRILHEPSCGGSWITTISLLTLHGLCPGLMSLTFEGDLDLSPVTEHEHSAKVLLNLIVAHFNTITFAPGAEYVPATSDSDIQLDLLERQMSRYFSHVEQFTNFYCGMRPKWNEQAQRTTWAREGLKELLNQKHPLPQPEVARLQRDVVLDEIKARVQAQAARDNEDATDEQIQQS